MSKNWSKGAGLFQDINHSFNQKEFFSCFNPYNTKIESGQKYIWEAIGTLSYL